MLSSSSTTSNLLVATAAGMVVTPDGVETSAV
jgi:hypothetical protein